MTRTRIASVPTQLDAGPASGTDRERVHREEFEVLRLSRTRIRMREIARASRLPDAVPPAAVAPGEHSAISRFIRVRRRIRRVRP